MVSPARIAAFTAFAIPVSMLPGYLVAIHLDGIFGLGAYMFWVATVVLGVLFLGGMGMSAVSDNPTLRVVRVVLAVWVGFFLILIFVLLFFDVAGLFFRWPDYRLAGSIVIVLSMVLALAGAVNSFFVRTRKIKVIAGKLEKPLRVVLLSDLHLGPVHGLKYFRQVVAKANRENPDIVLITGDLIDGHLSDGIFSPIDDIKAPVYFSVGNHEHYAGMEEILGFLGRTKAVSLVNRLIDVGDIELAGIDFDWNSRAFEGMVAKVVPSGHKYSILMSHGPPAFDAARKAGFDLTVSGHTHGGQFWPFTAFGRLFVKYRQGLYKKDGRHLYVTPGTGTWGPPIRLGTSSEVTVIDIG